MTVYVDNMHTTNMGNFGRMKMSHMIADTPEELHAMAERIGMKRAWFQGDHYDVSMSRRNLAINAGAVPITMRQLGILRRYRRKHGNHLSLAECEEMHRKYCDE